MNDKYYYIATDKHGNYLLGSLCYTEHDCRAMVSLPEFNVVAIKLTEVF